MKCRLIPFFIDCNIIFQPPKEATSGFVIIKKCRFKSRSYGNSFYRLWFVDLQTKALFSSYGYFNLQWRLLLSPESCVVSSVCTNFVFNLWLSLAPKRLLFVSYKSQKRAAKYSQECINKIFMQLPLEIILGIGPLLRHNNVYLCKKLWKPLIINS